ncbi:hypothetical protein M231_03008 [Tremella mesenterica]|uniref:BRCT domain-containing protein n=1 Tax=Tremella mesenterica TaxID=5217 RepID=A0A4Q1BP33_TREME|nr:hypothetical protein M231_03008 [Tremella mesenterica]
MSYLPTPDAAHVLKGERVYFAQGHFDDDIGDVLRGLVKRLGAIHVTSIKQSTIFIHNPLLPILSSDSTNIPSSPVPEIRPYHWLSLCLNALTRVTQPTHLPFFVHPGSSSSSTLPTPSSNSRLPEPTTQHELEVKPIVHHDDIENKVETTVQHVDSKVKVEKSTLSNEKKRKKNTPLKVWVSVNLARMVNEMHGLEAQATVRKLLEYGGALSVDKRSSADVLVVDRDSNFFRTQIMPERERNGRFWQKVVERDWVEACVKDGKLDWKDDQSIDEVVETVEEKGMNLDGDGSERSGIRSNGNGNNRNVDEDGVNGENGIKGVNDGERAGGKRDGEEDGRRRDDQGSDQDEVDSMIAEDEIVSRGPGRPTGKPRVDYTPEDDDFLCRYLAAYHPGGSWQSRKTYSNLISMEHQFPIIGRHSDQSWHERFKRNQVVFTRRIERFRAARIDRDTLKTKAEQEKEMEKERTREQEKIKQREKEIEGRNEIMGTNENVVVSIKETTSTNPSVLAAATGSSGDIDTAPLPPVAPNARSANIDTTAPIAGTGPGTAASREKTHEQEHVDMQDEANRERKGVDDMTPPMIVLSSSSIIVNVNEQTPLDQLVDRALVGDLLLPSSSQMQVDDNITTPIHSPIPEPSHQTTKHDPAVVPNMENIPSIPSHQFPPETMTFTFGIASSSKNTQIGFPSYPISTQPTLPLRDQRRSTSSSHTPRKKLRSMKDELVEIELRRHSSSHKRLQSPFSSTPQINNRPESPSMTNKTIPQRRNEEEGFEHEHEHDHEQILSNTNIPIPIPPESSTSYLPVFENIRKRKSITPQPVTPTERVEKYVKGKEIVVSMKEMYRKKISELSKKYGVRPTGLMEVIDKLPKSQIGGKTYWQDVERGLEVYFKT